MLIELTNREAFVKRYISRSDHVVRAEQYNPAAIIEYPADTVLSVFRIMGATEE